MRITIKDIEMRLQYINELTKSPLTTYTKDKDGKFIANIGNFHIYRAYGSIGVHRISNKGGGVETIIGLGTKKECYNELNALIKGITISKELNNN